jgi:HTH-type transcriptional regulator/antitoxin HigA
MELKYKVIKSKSQYREYCTTLGELVLSEKKAKSVQDEIDLLTLLIEKWDAEHNTFYESDPVKVLHALMEDHNIKAKDLVDILGVSKGLVSDILNYKKGFSKDIIRILSNHFKVSQELFNRPYRLRVSRPLVAH